MRPLTKWTPDLREEMFTFFRTPSWELGEIIKECDKNIKGMRSSGQSGTLEEINYFKAKKAQAKTVLRSRGY